MLADLGSRISRSSDEWSVCRTDLATVFSSFQILPEIDAFAVASNAISDIFYSPVPQIGASAIDFFSQAIDPSRSYFFCPPVSLISRLLRLIFAAPPFTFVLVIPDWPSKSFWALAHPAGVPHPRFSLFCHFTPSVFCCFGTDTIFHRASTRFIAFGHKI